MGYSNYLVLKSRCAEYNGSYGLISGGSLTAGFCTVVVFTLCISKSVNANYLINECSYRKSFNCFPSLEFNNENGVCFNAVRAVFLKIFETIQTYRHTYIRFNIIIWNPRPLNKNQFST